MICKWCGAEIVKSAGKCKSCGKAIPPLSDCGGFYDLVPEAKTPKVSVNGDPASAGEKDVPNMRYDNDKRKGSWLVPAILIAAAVVITLLFCDLRGQVKDCMELAEQNQQQIKKLTLQLEQLQNATEEPTEEPTEEFAEEPTEESTEEPTVEHTEEPTVETTEGPTEEVTEQTAEATEATVEETTQPSTESESV